MKTRTKRIITIALLALFVTCIAAGAAYGNRLDKYCATYMFQDGTMQYIGIRARDIENAGRQAWKSTPLGGRLISLQVWPPQRVSPSVWAEED